MKCPGQDSRNLKVSYHPCPVCGKLVEFFSDELSVRCPVCKSDVYTEQTPSCIMWCKSARQCIGPEQYDAIMKQVEEAAKEHHDGQEKGD